MISYYYSSDFSMSLRAADDPSRLSEPSLKGLTCGSSAFSNIAPRLYNILPCDIKNAITVDIFKKKFKSHLFKRAFDPLTKTYNC